MELLFRTIGHPDGEASALNGIGEVLLQAGRRAEARTHHAEALAIATENGDRDEQQRAHAGIARAQQETLDQSPR